MTDTGMPTVEDAMGAMPNLQNAPKAPETSAERAAADATAKVFVTTIAEGVIQALVNIKQAKEGGITQEDMNEIYCLAALYGVEVETESEDKEGEEHLDSVEDGAQLLDENGNPLEYEQATEEELEAAFSGDDEGTEE